MIDTMIYVKTIKGIAKQFRINNNAIHINKNPNLILLSFHEKFLNFKENIGISLTSNIDMITDPMQMKYGFERKFTIAMYICSSYNPHK